MKELILCEYPYQVNIIENSIIGDEIIISFNPESNYELERHKLDYVDIRHYYDANELWNKYPFYRDNLVRLTNRLDEIVLDVDKRIKENNLKLFNYLHYIIMCTVDKMNYYNYILQKIVIYHKPEKIKCIESNDYSLNNHLMFNKSMIGYLVSDIKKIFNYEIEYIGISESLINNNNNFKSLLFGTVYKTIKYTHDYVRSVYRYGLEEYYKYIYKPKYSVLNIACAEFNTLKSELIRKGINVCSLENRYKSSSNKSRYKYTDEILNIIKSDNTIRSLLKYNNVDYYKIVEIQIKEILHSFDKLLSGYEELKIIFMNNKYNAVVFGSMTPFNHLNILGGNICNNLNVPYYCYMHGGYGANYSLSGYAASDYRLAKHHFVYGSVVSNLLKSNKCVTNLLDLNNFKMYVIGSPYFDKLYSNYKRPNNVRKKILLTLGNRIPFPTIYFGANKPYSDFSNWDEHKAIIKLLVKFQNNFEIYIKDMPTNNLAITWKKYLLDIGGSNIKLITNEIKYSHLIKNSDLNIFTAVSTPFFESLYTDADIFLIDMSDVTDESKSIFNKCISYSEEIDSFVIKLEKYLTDCHFYTQNKESLKQYYINTNNYHNRAKLIYDSLYSYDKL